MLKSLTFKRLRNQAYWKPTNMQIITIYFSQALACFFFGTRSRVRYLRFKLFRNLSKLEHILHGRVSMHHLPYSFFPRNWPDFIPNLVSVWRDGLWEIFMMGFRIWCLGLLNILSWRNLRNSLYRKDLLTFAFPALGGKRILVSEDKGTQRGTWTNRPC